MSKIIITGANGNLGSAVTKRMLNDGHQLFAISGKSGADDLPAHKDLFITEVDLTDEAMAQAYIKKTTETNPDIGSAILLAGGFAMGKLAETSTEELSRIIDLNFFTAYHIVRPLMAHFLERNNGGQFVLVGSRPGLDASSGKDFFAYSMSKAMIFKLAEFINAEGQGKGITATVIVPSVIDTTANRKAMPDADFSKWVPAENIADAIAFALTETGSMLRENILKIYNKS
jgi:NAD(P)-dependent dehydrogenase (short-subunit alcohol dehydrogenase family)